MYVSDNYKEKNIIRQKKYLTAIQDLIDKKVDCVVMDELPALEIVKSNDRIKIIKDILVEDNYGIIVKKGNNELMKTINKVIERLNNEGKIEGLILEYSSK